jgi:hypothetical protein
MLALSPSCLHHTTAMHQSNSQSISSFFRPRIPSVPSVSHQTHHNTCTRVFHAAFKPFQVLLHPSSLESTCFAHAVVFPQFLHQCHQARFSSTPAPPNQKYHALRALPAFPACPVARNTCDSLLFLLQIMFPSCFGLCSHPHITTRAPTQHSMTVCSVLKMHE